MFSNGPDCADRSPVDEEPSWRIFLERRDNCAASIAIVDVLFTPASEMAEHVAKIAVRFRQSLFGFLAIASGCAHNDGNFQVGSGCLDELFGLDPV